MNDPFPELRINITEEKGWKPFDPSDRIAEWASDTAWEDFRHMSADDLWEYVNDLATARGKRGGAPRRKFSSDELSWLSRQVEDGNPLLEETRSAILDAMAWMYEAAHMPNRSDIEDAMDVAAERLRDEWAIRTEIWEPVLALHEARSGPKEWSPRKRLGAQEIMTQLVNNISFEQVEDHYDRFFVTDFMKSQVVQDLLARSDWQRAKLENALGREFRDLMTEYLRYFFSALNYGMEDLEISNRTNWRRSWKQMLNSGIAKYVQKEMAEAVRHMPPPEEDVDA